MIHLVIFDGSHQQICVAEKWEVDVMFIGSGKVWGYMTIKVRYCLPLFFFAFLSLCYGQFSLSIPVLFRHLDSLFSLKPAVRFYVLTFSGPSNCIIVQEVVTRPKIFYPIEFMWPKIILLFKRIIFNLKYRNS